MKAERVWGTFGGRGLWIALVTIIVVAAISCAPSEPTLPEDRQMTLALSSPAFAAGEDIPTKYTCDGQDISPPLTWTEPPSGTKSFVLIMYDPDAPGGVFTHWLLFNLPADARELPEAVPPQSQLENGALQGKNDFGKIGYGGPCPPSGPAHHYVFYLYALDQPLDLAAGASRSEVDNAKAGHIIAEGLLIGMYRR